MSAPPDPPAPRPGAGVAGTGTPEASEFRRAVGRFATGVVVVTTVLPDGELHAMTVNSFTSVSLEPLLVLFCAEKRARFHAAVLSSGVWAASVLGAAGEEASRWFAVRGRPIAGQLGRFAWHAGAATGCPLLDSAIATVECRTARTLDAGDHTVVLGEVLSSARPEGGALPLVYYEGGYRTL